MLIGMWALMCIAIPLWALFGASGWDYEIYRAAVESVHVGRDPYLDGIAKQSTYLKRLALHQVAPGDAPNNYVYPPVTLPLLRVAGEYPGWVLATGYWLLYALGALAVVWAGMQAVEADERRYLRLLLRLHCFSSIARERGHSVREYCLHRLRIGADRSCPWLEGQGMGIILSRDSGGLMFQDNVLDAVAYTSVLCTQAVVVDRFAHRFQWDRDLCVTTRCIASLVQVLRTAVMFVTVAALVDPNDCCARCT